MIDDGEIDWKIISIPAKETNYPNEKELYKAKLWFKYYKDKLGSSLGQVNIGKSILINKKDKKDLALNVVKHCIDDYNKIMDSCYYKDYKFYVEADKKDTEFNPIVANLNLYKTRIYRDAFPESVDCGFFCDHSYHIFDVKIGNKLLKVMTANGGSIFDPVKGINANLKNIGIKQASLGMQGGRRVKKGKKPLKKNLEQIIYDKERNLKLLKLILNLAKHSLVIRKNEEEPAENSLRETNLTNYKAIITRIITVIDNKKKNFQEKKNLFKEDLKKIDKGLTANPESTAEFKLNDKLHEKSFKELFDFYNEFIEEQNELTQSSYIKKTIGLSSDAKKKILELNFLKKSKINYSTNDREGEPALDFQSNAIKESYRDEEIKSNYLFLCAVYSVLKIFNNKKKQYAFYRELAGIFNVQTTGGFELEKENPYNNKKKYLELIQNLLKKCDVLILTEGLLEDWSNNLDDNKDLKDIFKNLGFDIKYKPHINKEGKIEETTNIFYKENLKLLDIKFGEFKLFPEEEDTKEAIPDVNKITDTKFNEIMTNSSIIKIKDKHILNIHGPSKGDLTPSKLKDVYDKLEKQLKEADFGKINKINKIDYICGDGNMNIYYHDDKRPDMRDDFVRAFDNPHLNLQIADFKIKKKRWFAMPLINNQFWKGADPEAFDVQFALTLKPPTCEGTESSGVIEEKLGTVEDRKFRLLTLARDRNTTSGGYRKTKRKPLNSRKNKNSKKKLNRNHKTKKNKRLVKITKRRKKYYI